MKRTLTLCATIGVLALGGVLARAQNDPPCTAPSITSQPASRTNIQGSLATFSVTNSGTAPFTYHWRKEGTNLTNGGNISGATNFSLTVSNVTTSDTTNYTVVVSNHCGSVTSSVATLTVIVPPSIIQQPTNQTVVQGDNATFSVTATGTAPLSYQWQLNGTNILNATANSYTIIGVLPADCGNYSVVVTNLAGSTNSATAVLSATTPAYGVLSEALTNFTFKGDTTYYINQSVPVQLYGTTTFEGGTVIKYANQPAAELSVNGPLVCQTGPYRPAVFTSQNDNTVGQAISGSTGNPFANSYSNSDLYINAAAAGTNAILQNLRIAYAQSAIAFNGSTGHVVIHLQLLNCANGLSATNTDFSLRNALFYNVLTNFNGSSSTGRCEHLTVDTANWMNNNNALTLSLTNSLLVSVTNTGNFTSNSVSTGTASAFQTVGAAGHYLADDTYRNAGTTNITASLLGDLKKKTTYPPIELTSDFTVDTTLSPQAQRDTDTPDLGYHYDPLDYVVSGRALSATMTLTNGVALGTYGASTVTGIQINSGGNLSSGGSATSLNRIVRYNTVQEPATTNWSSSTVATSVRFSTSSGSPRFTFTHWSLLAANGYHFTHDNAAGTALQDCQIGGGIFYSYKTDLASTNCLWDRVNLILDDSNQTHTRSFYNNLFRGGILNTYTEQPGWTLKDNLFDQTAITQSGTVIHSNNAYVSGSNRLTPTNANDVVLTNTPIYLTSYLGKYYYPTNDGMLSLLIDAGSRNATNAGLYHYTVLTNQVKETNSIVDIGYHYVATDTNGVPIDTDGDSVPDYLEDRNGNGTVDSGETDWTTYNSPNGLTGATGLQVFTPLK